MQITDIICPRQYDSIGYIINITKERKMKVGDLAETVRGNTVLVIEVGDGWCNILFSGSGFLRTGYPSEWLRRIECK